MEDKILVNLSTDTNHTFESSENIIGRAGEGGATRLEITTPEKLNGCSVYLDFEKPNGEKLRTPKLNIEDDKLVYDVDKYLLTNDGEIKVQAVLITTEGKVWKSSKKKYHIQKSINALEEIPNKEDFMTEVRRLLDELGNFADVDNRLSVLEKWMEDENYTKITASLTVSPSTAEVGQSITNAELTWSVSKETSEITLDDNSVEGTTHTDTNTYTSYKQWVLKVTETDRGATATATANLTFQHRVYYGIGTRASGFDSAFVRALYSKLQNSKGTSFTVAPNSQYVYYAVPKELCTSATKFVIDDSGFAGGFEYKEEVTVTNSYGKQIVYYVYRSDQLLVGSTKVDVS